jgi:hypothetical protein
MGNTTVTGMGNTLVTHMGKTLDIYNTVSNFSMGKYETTYELWYKVYQWAINNGYTFANAGKEMM